jgi:hypothetical protein
MCENDIDESKFGALTHNNTGKNGQHRENARRKYSNSPKPRKLKIISQTEPVYKKSAIRSCSEIKGVGLSGGEVVPHQLKLSSDKSKETVLMIGI